MCFCLCHASHIMSSCALHLHTCSSHAFEHFPRCPFCNSALLCHPVSLSTSFRVRVLNVFGLDRDLPCGLGLLPVDCLSSFVPFGLRLILQRLTKGPNRPRVCCNPFLMSFILQGSSNVPCSSFLTEVFNFVHLCCILSFKFDQPCKVLWFHSFVKGAT